MSGRRIWAIALRIILQFRRDHRTLALLFIVPIAILSLLGPLIETENTVRLGLNNRDRGLVVPGPPGRQPLKRYLSRPLVKSLESGDNLEVTRLSRRQIDRRLKDGRLDGALLIDTDFSRLMRENRRPSLEIVLEGSDPAINTDLLGQLQKRLSMEGGTRLKIKYIYGGSDLDALDYFAPVFIAFFVFFIVFLLTSVSFLRERGRGTIERLLVSPVDRFEIIAGYLLGFFIFAAIQSAVILLYTVWVLKAKFAGALWEIFIIELLLTMGSVSLGIFLSSFAKTELQAVQFIPLVVTPQALLSGMIWPLRSLPEWLQWLAALMPLTYANNALRALMIKGLPLDSVRADVGFLVAFAAVMIVLSVVTVKREIA